MKAPYTKDELQMRNKIEILILTYSSHIFVNAKIHQNEHTI